MTIAHVYSPPHARVPPRGGTGRAATPRFGAELVVSVAGQTAVSAAVLTQETPGRS